MKKIFFLTVLVLFISSIILGFVNSIGDLTKDSSLIFPNSYALTVNLNESSNAPIALSLCLFDSIPNSRRTSKEVIHSARIVSFYPIWEEDSLPELIEENYLSLEVEILDIEEKGAQRYGDYTVYKYNYLLEIPVTSNWEFRDAHLELHYINGQSEALYFGDIAFVNVASEAISSPYMQKLRALPVFNWESYEMTALIVEFKVFERIVLNGFDFGLSKYGINSDSVVVLAESMDRIQDMYMERMLDEDFHGIYQLCRSTELSCSLGDAILEPGIVSVIIPFVFEEGGMESPISVLGGLFYYSAGEENYFYCLESIPYITAFPQIVVQRMIENEWK